MLQLYPKPRKKSVMPTDFKNKILTSAQKIFAQKGYAKCTMSDVAIQAKVGIGTLYNYFKSKDEMLQLSIQKLVEDEIHGIEKESDKITDPLEKIRYFFNEHYELLKSKPHIARLLLIELRQSEGYYKRNPSYNPLNYYLNYYTKVFQEAIKQKRLRKVDVKALAYMVVGTQELIYLQWLIHGKDMDVQQIFNGWKDILETGLKLK
ncbi:MAG: TetR/AcrR family transcriptional regulator [Candidatus Cloacimonetes bacterium]|nr:TetR/AcrR family transcriptional regulator [Candidatus Cloacimonadota bacterium]